MGVGLPDLTDRLLVAELMDDPELDPVRHRVALEGLARINAVSLSARRVWMALRQVALRCRRTVRLLDVACGGGDVLRAVERRAARGGVAVEFVGCDRSPVALEYAQRESDGTIDFVCADVVADGIPHEADLVVSSLFLHHLRRPDAIELLASMADAAQEAVLVQDLRRSRLGYLFAASGVRILSRSPVVHTDGLRSVQGAFTVDEAKVLCEEAGLSGAMVREGWPQRFVVEWSRS